MKNECVAGEGGWEERKNINNYENICLTNLGKKFLESGFERMVLSVYLFVYVH